ncbi:molecular chaperone TorD [Pseudovibrio sp. Tun.PSC04-5.I4]|uniref:molecular chaperone TorD n=1 Tax=Pseudovibrio sp. Tun.PSC04-5.I4 TaxID=1798213 RepID=UPI00088B8C66|nr:molecular chaperone TorD [Pseudovibrio sp. Tun.PSC04-5.I4]SDR38364.1 Tat proofreading chaperone TorD [Pseudovibrio sp. Tun.PSC04-5.I4]
MGKHEDITLANNDRSLVYRWLASFFTTEVKAETLESYGSPEGKALLEVFAMAPALVPLTAELTKLADQHKTQPQLTLDLASAFSKLFLGAGGQRTAPPYESAYFNEKGTLFQKPTAEMNEILQDLGISVNHSLKEPADHLGIQLNVLAEYIDREALAEANGDSTLAQTFHQNQISFFSSHLLNWVPTFCESCKLFDSVGLYKELATSLESWLTADFELLSEGKDRP